MAREILLLAECGVWGSDIWCYGYAVYVVLDASGQFNGGPAGAGSRLDGSWCIQIAGGLHSLRHTVGR